MEKSHLTFNSVFVFEMHDLQEKYRAAMHKKTYITTSWWLRWPLTSTMEIFYLSLLDMLEWVGEMRTKATAKYSWKLPFLKSCIVENKLQSQCIQTSFIVLVILSESHSTLVLRGLTAKLCSVLSEDHIMQLQRKSTRGRVERCCQ